MATDDIGVKLTIETLTEELVVNFESRLLRLEEISKDLVQSTGKEYERLNDTELKGIDHAARLRKLEETIKGLCDTVYEDFGRRIPDAQSRLIHAEAGIKYLNTLIAPMRYILDNAKIYPPSQPACYDRTRCPRCGWTPEMKQDVHNLWFLACNCQSAYPHHPTKEEALFEWNKMVGGRLQEMQQEVQGRSALNTSSPIYREALLGKLRTAVSNVAAGQACVQSIALEGHSPDKGYWELTKLHIQGPGSTYVKYDSTVEGPLYLEPKELRRWLKDLQFEAEYQ